MGSNRNNILRRASAIIEETERLKAKKEADRLEAERRDEQSTRIMGQTLSTERIVKTIEDNSLKTDELAEVFSRVNLPTPEVTINSPDVIVPKADPIEVIIKEPKVKVIKPDTPKIPPIKVPKANITVKVPPIKLPKINVPKPEVTVNVPEFPTNMDVTVKNQLKKPVPVTLVGLDGKPMIFSSGGGRSARNDYKRSTTGAYTAVDIVTTATQVVGEVVGRKAITVTHESDDSVYLGFDDNVTTSNGFPVVANQVYGFGDYVGQVYAIISSGAGSSTLSLRVHDV